MSERNTVTTRSQTRKLAEINHSVEVAHSSNQIPLGVVEVTNEQPPATRPITPTLHSPSFMTPNQEDVAYQRSIRTCDGSCHASCTTSRKSKSSKYSKKRIMYETKLAEMQKAAIDKQLEHTQALSEEKLRQYTIADNKKQQIDERVLRITCEIDSDEDEAVSQCTQHSRTEEWVDNVSLCAPAGNYERCIPQGETTNHNTSIIRELRASRNASELSGNKAMALNIPREPHVPQDRPASIALDNGRQLCKASTSGDRHTPRELLGLSAPTSVEATCVYSGQHEIREPCDGPRRYEDAIRRTQPLRRIHGESNLNAPFNQPEHTLTATRQYQEDRQKDNCFDDKNMKMRQMTLENAVRNLYKPRQTYELPQFDGDPADWIAFKNMYEQTTAMYNFEPHENLARLQTTLKGEAKAAVEDLLRTAIDPKEIMSALENEFGHPGAILQCALRKVRNLPKMSESGRELKMFSTAVRNCVSLLKHIRAEGYINNPQLFNELLGKLTPTQRAKYGDYAISIDKKPGTDLRISPSLDVLSEFLAHLSKAASYYCMSNSVDAGSGTGLHTTTTNKPLYVTRNSNPKRSVYHVNIHSEKTPTVHVTRCKLCNAAHALTKCEIFLGLDVSARYDIVTKDRLCFRCLKGGHFYPWCQEDKCETCGAISHHTLLHKNNNPERIAVTENVTNIGDSHTKALLKVIPIRIHSINGEEKEYICYALLDDGATVSLVDSSLTDNVGGGEPLPLVIRSARGYETSDQKSRVVTVILEGPNGQCHKVKCRTISELNLPSQTVPATVIQDSNHLRDLGCEEMRDAKPLLLLGQDNWELLVSEEIRRGKSGKPVASLTKLGWVIHGPSGYLHSGTDSINCMATSLPDLHNRVNAQFELEAIGIAEVPRKHRVMERANAILDNTSRRSLDGKQWEVGLLWKQDEIELPDNYKYARQRLEGVEKKMKRDPIYAEAYTNQVNRLVKEGYASKVEGKLSSQPVWYLPHFGVINPNKPGKLRLVFDAAASFRGTCLNDNLLAGPDLLNSLLSVLFNFRVGPIGFVGDIADMFLRILIRKEDQGAQLFLWRGDSSKKDPDIYVMNSMIFGAVSSPATAIYILNKNAEEFRESCPVAVEAIRNRHYMDDYLDAAWTVDQANELIENVSRIHAAGGFVIRGWITNSPELREKLKIEMPERVALHKEEQMTERTLGLIWSPGLDRLAFDLSFKRLPVDIVTGEVIPTKREFLRFIMSIYDPLGFLYPCVIQSRILMQKIWKSGIQWDDQLNKAEADVWFTWLNNLHVLQEVSIPRWYGLQPDNLELHVFGDASESAYAAVAYLAGKNANGDREVAMVIGKARVTPQKVISIPRLELQAAVLASRLATTVENELKLPISNRFLWTDSKTVLKWINSEAHEFQRFVSHRLSEIDRKTQRSDWHWVPSAENPADKATRFDWPDNCKEWLSGPSFLRCSQEQWPSCDIIEVAEEELERVHRVHVTSVRREPLMDYTRFSSWTRTLRVIARVLVFINRCRKRRATTELCAQDVIKAEEWLLKFIQCESFRPG